MPANTKDNQGQERERPSDLRREPLRLDEDSTHPPAKPKQHANIRVDMSNIDPKIPILSEIARRVRF